jgi:hypothetical protein
MQYAAAQAWLIRQQADTKSNVTLRCTCVTDRAQTGRLLSGRHPFNTCSCGWLQVYSELLKQCGGVIKSRTDLKDLMDELKVGARHPNTHFRVWFCVVLLVSWQKSCIKRGKKVVSNCVPRVQ